MYSTNRINKSGHNDCNDSQKGPDLFCINPPELSRGWLGHDTIFLDKTDSTNKVLKESAEALSEGTMVIAGEQTAGRGRMERSWSSPKGEGIWMSFLLRPQLPPAECSGLTLVTALALTRALRNVTGLDLMIKWPNDVVCNGKKIAGILTEMSTKDMEVDYIVVGVGINVGTMEFPDEIRNTASSLYLEGSKELSHKVMIKEFCREFEQVYPAYIKTGNMSTLRAEYEALLVNLGRTVSVIEEGNAHIGEAIGVNDEGELLFKCNSEITAIRAGEVSVRGVYGYV